MRILIYGAGAVGGYLGGILTVAKQDVTLVARGAHYDAMAKNGLHLDGPRSGGHNPIRVKVCRPGEEKGPFDLIFVGLKSHQIAASAKHLAGLLKRDGTIVFAQNGISWWYFEKLDSPLRGTSLPSLDPDGFIKRTIPIDSVLGGVINKPADLYAPGCIRLADQDTDRLVLGELDDRITPRLKEIAALIEGGGWKVLASDNVRLLKWRKQMSNGVLNAFGALTQSSARQIGGYEPSKRAANIMMHELVQVAASVGVKLDLTPEQLLDDTQKRVEIPSSTLQDARLGRELELSALTYAVIDIGRLTGVRTPNLEVLAAMAGLLSQRIVQDGVGFPPTPVKKA